MSGLAGCLPVASRVPQQFAPRVGRVVSADGDLFEKATPASLPSEWTAGGGMRKPFDKTVRHTRLPAS